MGFISDFFNRNKIDALSEMLGKQFLQRLPPHRANDEKRLAAEFEIILGHVQGFQRKESLGTFGKARLINGFQWKLIENGYEKSLAQELSRNIAMRLTAAPSDKPAP